jgi:hypothetical protein
LFVRHFVHKTRLVNFVVIFEKLFFFFWLKTFETISRDFCCRNALFKSRKHLYEIYRNAMRRRRWVCNIFLSKKCINKNCCKLRSWVYFFMNFCLHEFLAIFWIFNSSKNKAFLVFNIYFGKEQVQRKYGYKIRNIFVNWFNVFSWDLLLTSLTIWLNAKRLFVWNPLCWMQNPRIEPLFNYFFFTFDCFIWSKSL